MHKLKGYSLLGGVITLLLLACILNKTYVSANSSGWLTTQNLVLQKQMDFITVPPSVNGNVDCIYDGPNCVISTPYGYATQNSSVELNNSKTYTQVISSIDSRPHYLGIPNSDQFISYTTEPTYGLYFYFTGGFHNGFKVVNSYGTSQYQVNKLPDGKLADKTGRRLAADPASLNYSENSQWMVVADPNTAMLRVNLETLEALPFGPAYNYTLGLSPSPHTAITNDGRYAAVASKDFSNFYIYDLSTCPSTVPSSISAPLSCQSRDIYALLKQQVPGFYTVTNLKFIGASTLSMYVAYKDGTANKVAKYIISTQQGPVHQLDYIALGDSYISGEGAFNYEVGTDTKDNSCHLSLISYPLLMGLDLNFNSYHSVACAGAETNDVIDIRSTYKGQVKNGFSRDTYSKEALGSILSEFKPGYIDQLDFVSTYQPQSITVSIGGNDIGFSNIIKRCLEADTCYNTYEDRLELVRQINQTFPSLVNTYTNLKNESAPDTRIYIIGYPQIADPTGNCALNVHLSYPELEFSKELTAYLDTVIEAAAKKVGVTYIDTQDALNGHRLCEAKPGSVAVNGLTAGGDAPAITRGPIGKESYHPNDFGHQLLEEYIRIKTSKLAGAMPLPISSSTPPSELGLEILNAPKSGRPINTSYYSEELSNDTITRDSSLNIDITGDKFLIKPDSYMQVVLNSIPTLLGQYRADTAGNISANVPIPSTIYPGIHTLHLYGTDVLNQPIDIYKIIYVADGIHLWDVCGAVDVSGNDYDNDGIDDACDPNITEALPTKPLNYSDFSSQTLGESSVLQAPVIESSKINNFNINNKYPDLDNAQINTSSFTNEEEVHEVLADETSRVDKASKISTILSGKILITIAIFSGLGGLFYWKFWR